MVKIIKYEDEIALISLKALKKVLKAFPGNKLHLKTKGSLVKILLRSVDDALALHKDAVEQQDIKMKAQASSPNVNDENRLVSPRGKGSFMRNLNRVRQPTTLALVAFREKVENIIKKRPKDNETNQNAIEENVIKDYDKLRLALKAQLAEQLQFPRMPTPEVQDSSDKSAHDAKGAPPLPPDDNLAPVLPERRHRHKRRRHKSAKRPKGAVGNLPLRDSVVQASDRDSTQDTSDKFSSETPSTSTEKIYEEIRRRTGLDIPTLPPKPQSARPRGQDHTKRKREPARESKKKTAPRLPSSLMGPERKSVLNKFQGGTRSASTTASRVSRSRAGTASKRRSGLTKSGDESGSSLPPRSRGSTKGR